MSTLIDYLLLDMLLLLHKTVFWIHIIVTASQVIISSLYHHCIFLILDNMERVEDFFAT